MQKSTFSVEAANEEKYFIQIFFRDSNFNPFLANSNELLAAISKLSMYKYTCTLKIVENKK